VVGGGGGGAGGSSTNVTNGGTGGGTNGNPGLAAAEQSNPGQGATGATGGDGGAAGTGGLPGGTGQTGLGGTGANGAGAGGGGGGGLAGGGGAGTTDGRSGAGGGGGSGLGTTLANDVDADNNGNGRVTITPIADSCPLPSTLQVRKVVKGDADEGFTVHVRCTGIGGFDLDLVFDENGTPGPPPAGFGENVDGLWQFQGDDLGSCTATETDDGDADSVRYTCDFTFGVVDNVQGAGCPGNSSGPSSNPRTVTFEGNGDVGRLTVTNRFEDDDDPKKEKVVTPLAPAQALAVAPAFTG
jgi:hypothetical protein